MTGVVIASITTVGAIIVAMIERVRRQNSREHNETGGRIEHLSFTLGKIDGKLDGVADKLDNHLQDHRSPRR